MLLTPVRILFTFVIPATVTAYLPSLLILGLPGPAFLPSWLGWFAPVFAVWAWLLALLAWRAGIPGSPERGADGWGEPIVEFAGPPPVLRGAAEGRPVPPGQAGGARGRRDQRDHRAGEACGYIGANGAGKSTTIKMLTGILVPTGGTVRTCGLDPVPQPASAGPRDRGGLRPAEPAVVGPAAAATRSRSWPPSTASTRQRPATRTAELVDGLELGDLLDTPVRQLSLGERMRGEVAAALVHRPRLLVLDEPTIGLDMISKERLRQFLIAERSRARSPCC